VQIHVKHWDFQELSLIDSHSQANIIKLNKKPRESPAFRQGEESGQPHRLRFWVHT
jgi:hypothetical protein